MYGVTPIDGFSRKIVGMITIPVPYFDETITLWQQIRIDHGTEFF